MERGHLLMTGATGGLGREVLPRLLRDHPTWKITVLTRETTPGTAHERFDELRRFIAFSWPQLDVSRVEPLIGDVAEPGIGLLSRDRRRLCSSVTHILHVAASIKLGLPRAHAWRVNVGGTDEILALAKRCTDLRRLAHVSTAYVAGGRNGHIREEELDDSHGFLNAYEASKFEAELLMRECMSLLPITIFRPSIIVGDSRDGRTTYFNGFYSPLRWIVAGRLRRIEGEASTPLDLVPVDVAAGAIAGLIDHPRSPGRTYHLTAGQENLVTVEWLLSAAIQLWGGPSTPPLQFISKAPRRPTGASGGMEWFFAYLGGAKLFAKDALQQDLPQLAAPHPRSYLPTLLNFCRATRWGRDLPWNQEACLTGGVS